MLTTQRWCHHKSSALGDLLKALKFETASFRSRLNKLFRVGAILAAAAFAASGLFGQALKSDTLTVNVPATANPYLAGMPNGTKARIGDSAPQQSPVLVERTLSHAVAVTFSAVGSIEHTPACPPNCYGPNGAALARHRDGAEHGMPDVIAPTDGLMGVFLSDERPDRSKPPRGLDFRAMRRDAIAFHRN